jgi:hypothetical protein
MVDVPLRIYAIVRDDDLYVVRSGHETTSTSRWSATTTGSWSSGRFEAT